MRTRCKNSWIDKSQKTKQGRTHSTKEKKEANEQSRMPRASPLLHCFVFERKSSQSSFIHI